MSEIEIRATAPDEYRAAAAAMYIALMHAPANDEDWEKSLPSWDASDSLSAWDGDRCAGHVAGYRFDTIVPGGARLATCGVTRVGVPTTYRRRGIARRLMLQLLVDARARGQIIASLRASDSRIYPRFGFGLAGVAIEAVVRPGRVEPLAGTADGTMRILAHDEVLATVAPLYDRIIDRPGTITRPDWMWKRYLSKTIELGGDADFVAVHTSADGVDDGFVNYSVKWKETPGEPPAGVGEVYDVWGADPSVELALWQFICDVDLVAEWKLEERPIDDPVQLAFNDWRAYQATARWDEQWLRLLDVDAALPARTYNDAAGSVTIAVHDELFDANTGVWEISAQGAKPASLDPGDADLACDVRELSAAYLGGAWWSSLAAAGKVEVRDAGALRAADLLFVSPRAPFCGSGF